MGSARKISIFGGQRRLGNLVCKERRCYLPRHGPPPEPARVSLSAWSLLPAAAPPLSPASSPRSHVASNVAVLEHLCARPPPSDLSLLAHLHTPPASRCLTKHDLWFPPVPTIHLGTPKCWVIVLNACLESRPNSSLRSKLSFLLAHSDLRWGGLLASIKAPGMR